MSPARHRLAVAMAVAATIATSPPYSELSERHEGAAFDLAPDRSEVRIPFRTAMSDSLARKGAWGTTFDVRAVWRTVPSPLDYRHQAGVFGSGIPGHRPDGELTTAAPALLACQGSRCSLDFALEHVPRDFGPHGVTFEWSVTAELIYPFAEAWARCSTPPTRRPGCGGWR